MGGCAVEEMGGRVREVWVRDREGNVGQKLIERGLRIYSVQPEKEEEEVRREVRKGKEGCKCG